MNRHIKSFAEITSPEDFVVREHFEMVRRETDIYSKQTATRSFNLLIDTPKLRYARTLGRNQDPTPFPGIILSRRTEAGLPPSGLTAGQTDYRSVRLANFAILAGSIVEAGDNLNVHLRPGLVREFTLTLVERISNQIETERFANTDATNLQ